MSSAVADASPPDAAPNSFCLGPLGSLGLANPLIWLCFYLSLSERSRAFINSLYASLHFFMRSSCVRRSRYALQWKESRWHDIARRRNALRTLSRVKSSGKRSSSSASHFLTVVSSREDDASPRVSPGSRRLSPL